MIDNASTDRSIEVLQSYADHIRIVQLEKNYGFARGYNEGLKNIQADIYVLLNSDVRVTPEWLHPLVATMSNEEVGACQPKILSDQKPECFEYAGACGGFMDVLDFSFCRGRIFNQVEEDHGQYDSSIEVSWATGAALCIRADLYDGLGGFDGSYFAHFEEIDLCWRLRRASYKIHCNPKSVVYHLGGGTLNYQSPNKVFLNYRNNFITIVKNEPWSRLWWLLPVRFVLEVISAYKYLFGGYTSYFLAVARAHFQMLGKLPQSFRQRKIDRVHIDQIKRQPSTEIKNPGYKGSIIIDFFFLGKQKYSEL